MSSCLRGIIPTYIRNYMYVQTTTMQMRDCVFEPNMQCLFACLSSNLLIILTFDLFSNITGTFDILFLISMGVRVFRWVFVLLCGYVVSKV